MNVIGRNVLQGAMGALAGLYAYVGLHEVGTVRLFGTIGGVLIVAALFARSHSRVLGAGLLLIGALPLAIATWWSIITPLIALLLLLLGWIVLARKPTIPGVRGHMTLISAKTRSETWRQTV
jgi:uncharacterized membrane protein